MAALRLERLDDNALYELFAESRSHLGGLLLRRANEAEAKGKNDVARIRIEEYRRIRMEFVSVPVADCEKQIALIREWDRRAKNHLPVAPRIITLRNNRRKAAEHGI